MFPEPTVFREDVHTHNTREEKTSVRKKAQWEFCQKQPLSCWIWIIQSFATQIEDYQK